MLNMQRTNSIRFFHSKGNGKMGIFYEKKREKFEGRNKKSKPEILSKKKL
jgi:hypothetical protein